VDFRLISATNNDLGELIKTCKFRKDLFYRINVIRIEIPPLRERKDDIPILFEHFMKEVCEQNAMRKKRIAPEVMECLMKVQWEGNVRELRNLVERLLVVSKGNTVTLEDLPLEYKNTCKTTQIYDGIPMNYEQAKTQFELNYLKGLLAYAGEDLKQASTLSGLDLSTLYRKKNKLLT
jgi:DNA-binding NtrC family response regulator